MLSNEGRTWSVGIIHRGHTVSLTSVPILLKWKIMSVLVLSQRHWLVCVLCHPQRGKPVPRQFQHSHCAVCQKQKALTYYMCVTFKSSAANMPPPTHAVIFSGGQHATFAVTFVPRKHQYVYTLIHIMQGYPHFHHVALRVAPLHTCFKPMLCFWRGWSLSQPVIFCYPNH